MLKTLRIARREYIAAVHTKGFIIGLVVAPLLMGGSLIAMRVFKDRVDTTDKVIAVVDHSGTVAEALAEAADSRNAETLHDEAGKKVRPAYIMEVVEPDDDNPDAVRLHLSDRIREGDLHAFVEIGPEVLHPSEDGEGSWVSYHAENAAVDEIRGWVEWPINNRLRRLRLAEAGVEESDLSDLLSWVRAEGLGLTSIDPETGEVREARRSSEALAIGVPFAMVMLMFMMTLMGAVPLLSAVMEEKTQRIAEVMLGSVKPFQFMMGKVLGGVGVSLTASSVYVVAGFYALNRMDLAGQIPLGLIAWFFVFMLLNITMLGSICASLGSTCNDAKEAQSVTMPAMIPVMIPMFLLVPIATEPLSGFATWLSLIPVFTPMVMMLRISTPASIPIWQPWVGLIGVIAFATLAVWAGGRIFRVGILMQGKPPRLSDILRWAIRG